VSEESTPWPESRPASREVLPADDLVPAVPIDTIDPIDPIDTAFARVREGLPKTYRMRADRHYVDQLDSPIGNPVRMITTAQIDSPTAIPQSELRSLIESVRATGIVHPLLVRRHRSRYAVIAGRKRLAVAQILRLETVPCLLHDVTDVEAAGLAAADNVTVVPEAAAERSAEVAAIQRLISDHLSTIRTSTDLLAARFAALDRSALDLIKANAWRASRLIAALDLVSNAPVPPRVRALSSIIDDAIEGFAAECRLTGTVVRADANDERWTIRLNAAEGLAGLSGALIATLALVEHADRPIIVIGSTRSESGSLILHVTQQEVVISKRAIEQFFDLESASERPGGHAAAIGALAAKTFARRRRGDATIEAIEGGSRLTMVIVP
jgi:ParB/RepB/Spo0J family partition protein